MNALEVLGLCAWIGENPNACEDQCLHPTLFLPDGVEGKVSNAWVDGHAVIIELLTSEGDRQFRCDPFTVLK